MSLWKTNITDFKYYLQVEKSLSINSVTSYEDDITKLMIFIEMTYPSKKPADLTLQDLQAFLKVRLPFCSGSSICCNNINIITVLQTF